MEAGEAETLGALVTENLADLIMERDRVLGLRQMAQDLLDASHDSKFAKLLETMKDPRFSQEKMLIFTEHRDTANFLTEELEKRGLDAAMPPRHVPPSCPTRAPRRGRRSGPAGGLPSVATTAPVRQPAARWAPPRRRAPGRAGSPVPLDQVPGLNQAPRQSMAPTPKSKITETSTPSTPDTGPVVTCGPSAPFR